MAIDSTYALRYPANITDNSDWVAFDFYEYQPAFKGAETRPAPDGNTSFVSYNTYGDVKTDTASLTKASGYPSICLYMPEDVASNYSQRWSGKEFHPIIATALNGLGSSLDTKDLGKNVENTISRMTKAITDSAANTGGYLKILGATGISGALNQSNFAGGLQPNDILASINGSILNPNTEVLYEAPQLRNFSFTYRMTARNPTESKNIRKICNLFKKASLPMKGATGEQNLIQVPHIVKFTFKYKNTNSEWVSQFKPCAIGSVDINYTPDGAWSTFTDGSPTAVVLKLQMQELKILFADEVQLEEETY
jgi:hypothetical protein